MLENGEGGGYHGNKKIKSIEETIYQYLNKDFKQHTYVLRHN